MNKQMEKIKNLILCQNKLIFASKFYKKNLQHLLSEQNYYKILERMTKKEKLGRISKGIYYVKIKGKYGYIKPSSEDIIHTFTLNNSGMIIGYELYNRLNITTQISKNLIIYSSSDNAKEKVVNNITIKYANLNYTSKIKSIISCLEILEHFNTIQDINLRAFITFMKDFTKKFNDNALRCILREIHYKKSTLAFLKCILDYYKVNNKVDEYYSPLSKFKHPKMEEIIEAA